MQTVLAITPAPPRMLTDCQALLATAASGLPRAGDPRKPLARIWHMAASALDGDLASVADKLVWMPAHCTLAAVGEHKLSDGSRLSCLDWRANRLADAAAKGAASTVAQPLELGKLLRDAAAAVLRLSPTLPAGAKQFRKIV